MKSHPAALLLAAALLPAQAAEKPKAEAKPQDPKKTAPTSKGTAKKSVPNPKVLMKTSMGDITLELFANEAPKTVANFVGLAQGTKEFTDPKTNKKVKRPYFDGLIFHRVIANFMAQGGCPLGTGTGSPGYKFEDEINAKALGLDKQKAWVDTGGRKGPNPNIGIRNQQQFRTAIMGPLIKKLGIKSQADLDKRRKDFDAALGKMTVMEALTNMGYKYDDSRPSTGMLRGTIAMANSGPNTNGSQFFLNMKDNTYLNGKHTVFGKIIKGMEIVDAMQKVKLNGSTPATPIKIVSVRRIGGGPTSKPAKKPK